MKIGVIRRRFAKSGGAEIYTQRLLQGLVAKNHEPHLFAENWDEVPEGVVYHPVQSHGGRAERFGCFAQKVRAQAEAEKLDCILSLERTLRQDVYRAGDGVHKVWLERRRRFSPWWKRLLVGRNRFHRNMQALERHVFDVRNTGHVIVNSERVRTEILENFEFPAERIHLIRNGVETRQFETLDRREFRRRHGFSDEDFVISFVGSGWERKGLPFILNAMRLLPKTLNVCLLVAGKGGRPLWVPPRVTFAGPVRNVEEVYAASDLFITLPIYEPSANVVFEAMAAGLPVITSAYNGAAELLEEGITGSVIQNPADADAVAAQMLFWIQNGRRPSCPAPLRRFLDISRNVEETLALLESIVEQRRGAGTK